MSAGHFDYSHLPIGGLGKRQIRLIRILPGSGRDPIYCELAPEHLPEETPPVDTLPANYIHWDDWITGPKPDEAFGADLLREIRKLREQLRKKEGKRSRVLRNFNNLMHRNLDKPPLERDHLLIPVLSLRNMATQEDILTIIENDEVNDGLQMNLGFLGRHDKLQSDWDGPVAQVPLNSIPYFYRQSGEENDQSADVGSAGNYIAMSYEWGDPEGPKETIFLNKQPFEVRKNLYDGLREFRQFEYFRQGGKIWIDALCINQSSHKSNSEKDDQVQLMGSIYRCASNIIVWLGLADQYSDKAIDSLQKASLLYRTEYVEVFDNADPLLATAHRQAANLKLKATLLQYAKYMHEHNIGDEEDDVAIYNFFNRSYWRRLWIIQELANGRSGMPIVCGSRITQWRYIRDGAFVYASIMDLLHESTPRSMSSHEVGKMTKEYSIQHLAGIAQLEISGHRRSLARVDTTFLPIKLNRAPSFGPLKGSQLKQALMLASQADVFNPKDRVYGMLQIPSLPNLAIDVCYEKSIGTVYTEFVQAVVEVACSLDFLFLIDGSGLSLTDSEGKPLPKPIERIPSWVPDFGSKRRRRPGVIEGEWYASGNKQGFEWSQDGRVKPFYPKILNGALTCWGFVVERVDGVGAINPKDIEGDQVRPGLKFEVGIVQATPGQSVHGYYDMTSADQKRLDEKVASLTDPVELPYATISKVLNENERDPIIYWVLTGGTTFTGAKAPSQFGCLTRSFTIEEPPPDHPNNRNWHFINSNARLIIRNNKTLKSFFTDLPSSSSPPDPATVIAAQQSMQARTMKRRLIITASGLLGLAPIYTQPGDCIIILIGHGVPIVARPLGVGQEGGSGRDVVGWHLIGECFVDGMMEEEMMKRDIWSHRKQLEPLYFV